MTMTAKRILSFTLLLVLLLTAGGLIVHYWPEEGATAPGAQGGGMRSAMRRGGGFGGGVVPVQADTVTLADVAEYVSALGTVVPNAAVTVTSRVDGQLLAVHFTEGQMVKPGQLLATLDSRGFEATLAQYQGALAQDAAQLKNAQLTLARYRTLYAQDSLAKQDLESQIATVAQYQGAVASDKAQIAAAKLDLEYSRITAPIGGRVGLRLVDPGNMVHASDTTGLVTITQVTPIAVTFSVPQSYVPSLRQALQAGKRLTVIALDQDNQTQLAQGELNFMSNSIDASTGTLALKALFANQDEALYPNQFVNVRLQIRDYPQVPVVSRAAIQLASNGHYVYVIGEDDKVRRQTITVGPLYGSEQQAVLDGLRGGERLVTAGIDSLKDGVQVQLAQAASGSESSR
ncbi:efflux RND transporter periplasmic adaptor subunit [Pseudaeromonas paramecii]|uniref:MdtA/MuxA family multidrug efflux RND transporter periplasmic adaptor subunit n=1 Tax=Pseudaeromonas paramecii TaxID=2138166 RepID=A0ABP8QGG0_9GAMM